MRGRQCSKRLNSTLVKSPRALHIKDGSDCDGTFPRVDGTRTSSCRPGRSGSSKQNYRTPTEHCRRHGKTTRSRDLSEAWRSGSQQSDNCDVGRGYLAIFRLNTGWRLAPLIRQRGSNERSHGEGPGLLGCRGSQFPPLSFEPQSSLQSVVLLPVALAAHVWFPLVLACQYASITAARRADPSGMVGVASFPHPQVPSPPTPTTHGRRLLRLPPPAPAEKTQC